MMASLEQFQAQSIWEMSDQPLDLNGPAPGESLTLSGAAAGRTNLVSFAGVCTKSPSEKHRGYQGHVIGPLEISEIRLSKAGNGRNRQD